MTYTCWPLSLSSRDSAVGLIRRPRNEFLGYSRLSLRDTDNDFVTLRYSGADNDSRTDEVSAYYSRYPREV